MRLQTIIDLIEADHSLVRLEEIEIFDDGAGARCLLTVNSGYFACSNYPFHFDGFEDFCRDICKMYDKLKGRARLSQRYERDFLEFEMDKLGHVWLSGLIDACPEGRLEFHRRTDQTCLRSMVDSARSALKEIESVDLALHPGRRHLRRLFRGER